MTAGFRRCCMRRTFLSCVVTFQSRDRFWSRYSASDRDGDPLDGVALAVEVDYKWRDAAVDSSFAYLCARPATPQVASGGVMLGCAGGHWVMGTPYKQLDSLSYLPPTTVYGIYDDKVYERLAPTKTDLNETVTTPAECAALVHRDDMAI